MWTHDVELLFFELSSNETGSEGVPRGVVAFPGSGPLVYRPVGSTAP